MSDTLKERPVFRNIHVTDIVKYRLPPAGIVSILHRVSGAILFLLMPFVVWMFDTSVSSEMSYERFTSAFAAGLLGLPGWLVKLVTLGLIWAYLHHFFAGMRHIRMDIFHTTSKEAGKATAQVVLVLSLGLTAVLGAKLFGLY